jgi:hypothetical protein
MPSFTASVDVDLNDFDIDDILDHLRSEHLTENELAELISIAKEKLSAIENSRLKKVMNDVDSMVATQMGWPTIKSLADKYKQAAVLENWDRLSQQEFEIKLGK